jgi:4-carboxymuconolactone decarboxylase
MNEDQRRVYDDIVRGPRGAVVGPLLAVLHRPDLADRWQKLGELLRYRTSLPARLTELAVLVTARRWNCILEWHIHEPIAVGAGVPRDVVESIRRNERPSFANADDAAIHAFAKELQDNTTVSDRTYAEILERWGIVGVVELTALIGYYTMVAMTLNAHAYEIPDKAPHPFHGVTS